MIFYFSGTGNSLYAAKTIAAAQGEKLVSIAGEMDKAEDKRAYETRDGELLGFVFPVYAWGPPRIVLDFIGGMKLAKAPSYVFSLCTCGDDEGRTTNRLRRALERRGLPLHSAFTLRMPNNYIISFDVDPDELVREKLNTAKAELEEINTLLAERRKDVFRPRPGRAPGLKTAIVNPLFNRFGRRTSPFYATDACTRCGLCERICPVHTITVTDIPRWSDSCTQCLACLHRCPTRAIEYGKSTINKGRYVHASLIGEG